MNLFAYFTLCFGFTSFTIALFVWLRLRTLLGVRYFFFSACAGAWGMLNGICMLNDVKYDSALLSTRIAHFFAVFIAVGWYHFTLEFGAKKKIRQNVTLAALYISAIVISAHTFSDAFISRVRKMDVFNYFPAADNWVYHFFTVYFFTGVVLGFFNLFAHYKELKGEQKQSCGLLIGATLIGFIGGCFSFGIAYGFLGLHYGLLLMPLYPILIAIAMMRFDLFNPKDLALAAHKDKLAALGILTASINHEIRGPLFAMRGAVETRTDNEELKSKLLAQIDRLTGIVSRLTHFAKKGVDEEAKIEALDLNEVLADVRALIQYQLNYQSIEYIQEIPPNLPKLLADRRYLEEILFNLIINACQALQNRKDGKIKLSASPGKDCVEILIEDNGPGMSPSQAKNIFKPFHTTKSEGTGLGLYITKQLVEKCDGRIEARLKMRDGVGFALSFYRF